VAVAGQHALLANQRASQLLANASAILAQAPVAAPLGVQLPQLPVQLPRLPVTHSPPTASKASKRVQDAADGGPSHGTSAGFCNICKKYVSNRTNHKYVHSQVTMMLAKRVWNLSDLIKQDLRFSCASNYRDFQR